MRRASWAIVMALLAAAGCYAPDLSDCTVTCSGPGQCSGDQVCNSTGHCAAEGVTCQGATVDAPAVMVTLRVKISGTGKVVVTGVGECDDSECTWQVPNAPLQVEARETDDEKPFERWTTTTCGGAQMLLPSCTFTPTASTTVEAKFR